MALIFGEKDAPITLDIGFKLLYNSSYGLINI